jgi:hypothetical protein
MTYPRHDPSPIGKKNPQQYLMDGDWDREGKMNWDRREGMGWIC